MEAISTQGVVSLSISMSDGSEYEEALEYLQSLFDARNATGYRPGLEKMKALCERLGNPQDKLRCVHVGGTNGKGSVTAMVSHILRAAGYRVGSYYSPYVYDVRERVMVDCELITKPAFSRLINVIRPHADSIGRTKLGYPHEFEVKTALAFLHFLEQQVDFAVLEVGLGGRFDATNVVNPLVSVITNVTLDHMDRLGNTVAEIATEKAGIVKEGGHLVTASQDPDALEVLRRTCEERGATMWRVSPVAPSVYRISDGTSGGGPGTSDDEGLTVHGVRSHYTGLKLRMRGDFQQLNAATAIGVVEALREKGVEIPDSAVREGLALAYLPGRLEVLREHPTLMIDGAHNLDAAKNLARALKEWFAYDKLTLVMGMASGHSIADVVGVLAPLADRFIATEADNVRATPAESVAEEAKKHCTDVSIAKPVSEAVAKALQDAGENDLVCVTGSFYILGEIPRPAPI